MKIEISTDICLKLFNRNLSQEFYSAIHSIKDTNDEYRCHLQKTYDQFEKVESRVIDAIENKYQKDGTPDFFIYFQENLAGVFEFHPLTADDFVEVGYWLFSEYRRKGIISSVFPVMIRFAGENFSKSKIRVTTSIRNTPSQKLLESIDFKKTGKILEFRKEDNKVQKEFEYIYAL